MPPAFMLRISRAISAFVTAGPNHHQRIMIRESSGGVRNDDSSEAKSANAARANASSANAGTARRGVFMVG